MSDFPIIHDKVGNAELLARVDGWVMLRRYCCTPFLISETDLKKNWKSGLAPQPSLETLIPKLQS